MFDRECEPITLTAKVQHRVAPCVKFGATSERLTRSTLAATLLCMVHDDHGDFVRALQFSQERQEGCDIAGCVLILCDHRSNVTTKESSPRGTSLLNLEVT